MPEASEDGAPRTACERCYRNKEKCRSQRGVQGCERCRRLGQACIVRSQARMGRRPVAKSFSHGSSSVLSFGPATQIAEDETLGDERKPPVPSRRRSGRQGSLRTRDVHPAVSCGKPGYHRSQVVRRSRPTGVTSGLPISCPLPFSMQKALELGHVLNTKEGFYQSHRFFTLGRSFLPEFQATVHVLFQRSPQLLAESYNAALGLLDRRGGHATPLCEAELIIGTRCLQSLMKASARIATMEDAAVTLMVGQILIVYNTFTPFSATQAITRGALLAARDWYPELLRHPNFHTIIFTPILLDTLDCLVRRRVPVVRLPPLDRSMLDRFCGASLSILPLLYDLCECSHKAKILGLGPSQQGSGNIDHYINVESRIRAWEPPSPSEFLYQYSALETEIMLSHARLYRLAALLIIHRLRFPLGVEDDPASELADSIMKEAEALRLWPLGGTGLHVDFAMIMALVENPPGGEEIYRGYEPLRFRQHHCDEVLGLVQKIRQSKEAGYEGSWLDLIEDRSDGAYFI